MPQLTKDGGMRCRKNIIGPVKMTVSGASISTHVKYF